jgi:predicted ArsR family transcriptional regulator
MAGGFGRVKALPSRLAQIASVDARADVATQWSRGRGRISSTELADIVGVKVPQVQATLKALVDDGVIEPARGTGGRGFHYLPTDPGKR